MKILLDTHIFLWMMDEPERLSSNAAALLRDFDNELFLSVASVWEIQIKLNMRKLTLSQPLPVLIQSQREANQIQILPIELRHVYALANLPPHHRDPFDRLLIAQAQSETMPVLTADGVFMAYNISLLN